MHISHDFIATKTCPSYEFLEVFGQVRAGIVCEAGAVRRVRVRGWSGKDCGVGAGKISGVGAMCILILRVRGGCG